MDCDAALGKYGSLNGGNVWAKWIAEGELSAKLWRDPLEIRRLLPISVQVNDRSSEWAIEVLGADVLFSDIGAPVQRAMFVHGNTKSAVKAPPVICKAIASLRGGHSHIEGLDSVLALIRVPLESACHV
jgi:hypothetical protein